MRTFFLIGMLALALLAAPVHARAENYPNQPVRIIVPFSQGGSTSVTARYFQKVIQDQNILAGMPMPVVHMPGAGGTTGANAVKDANPDGYTLLLWHVGICGAEAMGNIEFSHKDFTPVAATGSQSYCITVSENSPYKTIQDLFAAAKANPETLTAGANLGAASHIGLILAEQAAPGVRFRYVQSGSTSKIYAALLGGHVEVGLLGTPTLHQVACKGVRPLAILAPQRDPLLPDVPTLKEAGYDVDYSMTNWWLAPKGMPADRVAVLEKALKTAMDTPEIKKNFESSSMTLDFLTSAELDASIEAQCKSIKAIAKRLRGEE